VTEIAVAEGDKVALDQHLAHIQADGPDHDGEAAGRRIALPAEDEAAWPLR
jgi:hypothetical protein